MLGFGEGVRSDTDAGIGSGIQVDDGDAETHLQGEEWQEC